jgi:hypothetical protein
MDKGIRGNASHLMEARKQKERYRKGPEKDTYNPKNRPLVTYFLQLSPTSLIFQHLPKQHHQLGT